jgi:hypothetical protein
VVVEGDVVEEQRGDGCTQRATLCGNRFRLEGGSLAGDVDVRAGCRCIVAAGTVLMPVVGQGLFGGRIGGRGARCGDHRTAREDRNCRERVVAVWEEPGFGEGSLRLVSIGVRGDFVWVRPGILPAQDTGSLHRLEAATFSLLRNSVLLQCAVRTHEHANKVV